MEEVPETSTTNASLSEDEADRGLTNYVQRVKIAVAVAVIKSTPLGMIPKDYATNLVQAYTNDVDSWKTKCRKLEEDVFSLEQRLETLKVKTNVSLAYPGFDTLQDCAPNLLEVPNENKRVDVNVKETMEFVRSFILLNSMSTECNRIPPDSVESPGKPDGIVLKSISNLFGYLKSKDGLKMEFDIVKRAIEEVHRLFEVRFGKLNKDLMQICLDFIDDLLIDIHKTLEINEVLDQHKRSSLIQMIAEHRSLTVLVLCRLLREITVTSDFLESLFREDNDNFLPLLHAENAYYVLQSTEGVLKIMNQQNSFINALKIPDNLLSEWGQTTDKSLSALGIHFPMYCIYVWHLRCLMKSICTVSYEEQ